MRNSIVTSCSRCGLSLLCAALIVSASLSQCARRNVAGAAPYESSIVSSTSRKQQYRVVKFFCGQTCDSCVENCRSLRDVNIDDLESTFVTDIIALLKFDEDRVEHLQNVGYYDRGDCENDPFCDRVTIDMGRRQLLIKCRTRPEKPIALPCKLPPNKSYLCRKNMLEEFTESIRRHDKEVHGGN